MGQNPSALLGQSSIAEPARSQASAAANVGSGLWVMGGAPADKVAVVGTAWPMVSLGRMRQPSGAVMQLTSMALSTVCRIQLQNTG